MKVMSCRVQYVVLLSSLLCFSGVWSQDSKERDAFCNKDGCYVLYFKRKIFLDAWRSCKALDGDLATIKHPMEAKVVERLFSNVELRSHHRGKVEIWIGLQRQPRQCAPTRPLRGFSWITGDQDTQYTNWLQEDSPNSCSSPHCVVTGYSTSAHEQGKNLKWKDKPCSISVDGYLCQFTYNSMCTALSSEGGGNILYNTPFKILSTILTHVPSGTIATVPCPVKEDQSVMCMQKEDGRIGWNRDPPVCFDPPETRWCDKDNGGCQHLCFEEETHYYCDCNNGFILAEDGVSCFPFNPCNESPCVSGCLPMMDSYRCTCSDGYMLAPDEHSCVDVNECLQSPCEQICVNEIGTFECRCREGYQLNEEGVCEDVDECMSNPCEHACENTEGSYICHCLVGYALLQEDQNRCYDIDECQIEDTCEQMCHNYGGSYDCFCKEGYNLQPDQYSCRPIRAHLDNPTTTVSNSWITPTPIGEPQDPVHPWNPATPFRGEWQTETPHVEAIPTDLIWFTSTTDEPEMTTPTESSPEVNVDGGSDLYPEDPEPNTFPPIITTPTPDYNEDESTPVPTVLPFSTAAGGAWIWLWFSPTQTEPVTQVTAKNPSDPQQENNSYEKSHGYTKSFDDELTTFTPDNQTSVQGTEKGRSSNDDNNNNNKQSQGSNLLLIGLLVPFCIFTVVMIILGIIYCTRYTVKPEQKNRNNSDCYHWIAGAGDKAAAEISGSGTKSHV